MNNPFPQLNNQTIHHRNGGFTLVELSVVMVVLGLIAIAVITLVPKLTERMRLDDTSSQLKEASEAITGFAVEESRLPCPDVNGDGLEGTAGVCDPADDVGTIPFRALGLPGPVLDEARLPLRYGAYRNAADEADLATLTNLFEPNIPGTLDIIIGTVAGCGEILEDVIQIIINNPSENILTVTPVGLDFLNVDDVVSGSRLDYNAVVPNGANMDFVAGEEINLTGLAPVKFCSINTGDSCSIDTDCPDEGFPLFETCEFGPPDRFCSITTGMSCNMDSDCPLIPSGAFCSSTTTMSCTVNTDCPLIPPDNLVNEICVPALSSTNETCEYGDHRFCDGLNNPPLGDPGPPFTQTCVVDSDCPQLGFLPGFHNESCFAFPPSAEVHSVVDLGAPNALGDRLLLPSPTGTFQVGDTIIGLTSGVTATVTDFYFPGSATITSVITAGTTFGVDLTPTSSQFVPPNFGFETSQLLFVDDEIATFVNLQKDTQLMFVVGETITGGTSGATGTIDSVSGTILTVSNVSGGPFQGPTIPTQAEIEAEVPLVTGEVITGGTSGATSEIVSIAEDTYGTPVVTVGSNPIPDPNLTVSGEENQLDMCKALRNGIQDGFATDDVHTVNDSSIVINPAFLVVSGGVEDASNQVDVAFDDLNEGIATLDFNSPAKGRDASYDDLVHTTPMLYLDQRLACPRNLGAVNAMANSAMVAQNIAISSFNNNENALQAILDSWAGLKLAEANVAIGVFAALIGAAECAKAVTVAIKLAGATALEVAAACAAAVSAGVAAAFAVDALVKATDLYEFSCGDQIVASGELSVAITAAEAARLRALEADVKGGVE